MGGFRGGLEPTDADLRDARWIDLSRQPASPEAEALAEAVAGVVAERQERRRPLGATGRATLQRNVGVLLAGLLRAAFRGHLVSAHRRPAGGVWQGAVVGRDAAWGILDALERAELVGVRAGVQTAEMPGDDAIFGGLPTRVWPKPALLDLAARLGVTGATLKIDWRVNPEAEQKRVAVADDDLVTLYGLGRGAARVPVRPDQAAEGEAIRAEVAALNAQIAAADVTGCSPLPAFRRVFRLDLRLGGRFYAVGGSNYQNQPKEDRTAIRIGGEPVAEVDLHAAYLTLLLGLSGHQSLPADDLYAAIGLPREASKAWFVQTFATGFPAGRWSDDVSQEVRAAGIKASDVRRAALRAYPELEELERIVPATLKALLPEDRKRQGWAVGQFLTNLEARVMASALRFVRSEGVVGLPMHDAIIVPASAAKVAAEGLRGACWAVARIEPKVKVPAISA